MHHFGFLLDILKELFPLRVHVESFLECNFLLKVFECKDPFQNPQKILELIIVINKKLVEEKYVIKIIKRLIKEATQIPLQAPKHSKN